MSINRTIVVGIAGLGVIALAVATATRERSPAVDRMPLAGSSVRGTDHHLIAGSVLRPDDVEVRRVLAHTGR